MAHKVFTCNQPTLSLTEISFGEQMRSVQEPTFDSAELSEKLEKAWYGLNHDERELLWLYVAEGLASAQIAERKQQSLASIRRALSNVYAQLLLQVDCT